MRCNKHCIAGVLAAAVAPNLGGAINGYYCKDAIKNWYPTLTKPAWCPPDWIFGPMWTSLYTGIGYGSFLIYKSGGGFNGAARLPLIAYGTNLALNWAWSPIFFNLKKLDWALYEILLLDVSTVATGYLFYQVNKTAGYLFIPYGMWLTLATALTYRIFKDNPNTGKAKITELKD